MCLRLYCAVSFLLLPVLVCAIRYSGNEISNAGSTTVAHLPPSPNKVLKMQRRLQVTCHNNSDCINGVEVCAHAHEKIAERKIGELADKIVNIRRSGSAAEPSQLVGICVPESNGILKGEGLIGGRIVNGGPRGAVSNFVSNRSGPLNQSNRFGGGMHSYIPLNIPNYEDSSSIFSSSAPNNYGRNTGLSPISNVSIGSPILPRPISEKPISSTTPLYSSSAPAETPTPSAPPASRQVIDPSVLSNSNFGETQLGGPQMSTVQLGSPQPAISSLGTAQLGAAQFGSNSLGASHLGVPPSFFGNFPSLFSSGDVFSNGQTTGPSQHFNPYQQISPLTQQFESIAASFLNGNHMGMFPYSSRLPGGLQSGNPFGGLYAFSSQSLAAISSQMLRQLVYRTIKPRIVCLPTEIHPQLGGYAFIRYPRGQGHGEVGNLAFLDSLSSQLQDRGRFLNLEYNHLFYILDPRFPMYDLINESVTTPLGPEALPRGVFGQQGEVSPEGGRKQSFKQNNKRAEESGAYTMREYLQKTDVLGSMFSQIKGMDYDKTGGDTSDTHSSINSEHTFAIDDEEDDLIEDEGDMEFYSMIQTFMIKHQTDNLQGQQTAVVDYDLPVVYVYPILSPGAQNIQPGIIGYQCTDPSTKYLWFRVSVFDGQHTVRHKCPAKIVCGTPYPKFMPLNSNDDPFAGNFMAPFPIGQGITNKDCSPLNPECESPEFYTGYENPQSQPTELQDNSNKYNLYLKDSEAKQRNVTTTSIPNGIYPHIECLSPNLSHFQMDHKTNSRILKLRKTKLEEDQNLYIFEAYALQSFDEESSGSFTGNLEDVSALFDKYFDLHMRSTNDEDSWEVIKNNEHPVSCSQNNRRFTKRFALEVRLKNIGKKIFEVYCPAAIDCQGEVAETHEVECLNYKAQAYVGRSISIPIISAKALPSSSLADVYSSVHGSLTAKNVLKINDNLMPVSSMIVKVLSGQDSKRLRQVTMGTTEYAYLYTCGDTESKEKLTFAVFAMDFHGNTSMGMCDAIIECKIPIAPEIECKDFVKRHTISSSSHASLNFTNVMENEVFSIHLPFSGPEEIGGETPQLNVEVRDPDSHYVFEERLTVTCKEKGDKNIRLYIIAKDERFQNQSQKICQVTIVCE